MVINALNTGANGYMLDLEDSMSPSWDNVINAHSNIIDAVRGKLTVEQTKNEITKKYEINNTLLLSHLNKNTFPSFFVRVRGLHMTEENVLDNYYKHQTASGTSVEAAFSEAVGSSNVNILSDSTESDDLKIRSN